jgi:hypothetical protein
VGFVVQRHLLVAPVSLNSATEHHEQVWIKVNAPVDQRMAGMVSLLNSVEGLETLQSCQGEPGGRDAYVYFSYGEWADLCKLVFAEVGPALKREFGEDVVLTVEATNAAWPMAKMRFKAEITDSVASALKRVLH